MKLIRPAQFTIMLVIFLAKVSSVGSQPVREWVRTYNGTGNSADEVLAMTVDEQSNVIVTGTTLATTGFYNIATIKYSPSGVQLWAAFYNGAGNGYDEGVSVKTDSTGNVYVAGRTLVSTGNFDVVVLKYNSLGALQWSTVWGNASLGGDYARSITVDALHNVYVSGGTEITGTIPDFLTIKLNPSGSIAWAKSYGHTVNQFDEAQFTGVDQAGSVYSAGISVVAATGQDFLLIKYSQNGDTLWSRRYSSTNNTENDVLTGFTLDREGNAYLTGSSRTGSTGTDYISIKYNLSGAEQWRSVYTSDGAAQDIPEDIAVDAQGNVFLTGRTRINSSYNDFATLKYNSSGVREWLAVYNNNGVDLDDYGYSITVDRFSNCYVAGTSKGNDVNSDPVVIKYNSAGLQQWIARYDSTDDEETFHISVGNDGSIYASGYIVASNQDFLTMKYSESVGVTQMSSEIPSGFKLEQNYPNPFNPETVIQFEVATSGLITLKVHDVNGKLVSTPVNSVFTAGKYKLQFNGADLRSGAYFYSIFFNNLLIDTRRMILLK